MTEPIGFRVPWNNRAAQAKNEEVIIADLDKEFVAMLQALQSDEKALDMQRELEEDIRTELLKLHKRAERLITESRRRDILYDKYRVLKETHVQDARTVFEEVRELDETLQPRILALLDEVNTHVLHQVAELYAQRELSDLQRNRVKQLALLIREQLQRETQHVLAVMPHHWDMEGNDLENRIRAQQLRDRQLRAERDGGNT